MELQTKVFLTTVITVVFMTLIIVPAKMGWHNFSLTWAIVGGGTNAVWLTVMWGEDLDCLRGK